MSQYFSLLPFLECRRLYCGRYNKIIFNCSIHYPRDIFYNMSYPDLDFELTKLNNEQIYQITFVGYGWVSDTYLQFTKIYIMHYNKIFNFNCVFG